MFFFRKAEKLSTHRSMSTQEACQGIQDELYTKVVIICIVSLQIMENFEKPKVQQNMSEYFLVFECDAFPKGRKRHSLCQHSAMRCIFEHKEFQVETFKTRMNGLFKFRTF